MNGGTMNIIVIVLFIVCKLIAQRTVICEEPKELYQQCTVVENLTVIECIDYYRCNNVTINCPFNANYECNALHNTNYATYYCCYGINSPFSSPSYKCPSLSPPYKCPSSPPPYNRSILRSASYGKFTKSLFLRSVRFAAVGFSSKNNSIFLFGGDRYDGLLTYFGIQDNEYSLIRFDLDTNTFYDYGSNYLSDLQEPFHETGNWNAGGQYWSQLHEYLYITAPTHFYSINMDTVSISTYDIPQSPYAFDPHEICLTSAMVHDNDYLFILGQGDGINDIEFSNIMQIFNISNRSWIKQNQIPSMTMARSGCACAVSNNLKLYAISGYKRSSVSSLTAFPTWEYINIDDLFNEWTVSWIQLPYTVPHAIFATRPIVYYHKIFCIGGRFEEQYSLKYLDYVYVINTIDNTIENMENTNIISAGGRNAPAIIINHRLYVWGDDTHSHDPIDIAEFGILPNVGRFGFMDLLPPTQAPTADPSSSTSSDPTEDPSVEPTTSPSHHPTNAPSLSPSSAPTDAPSVAPTRFPTIKNAYDSQLNVIYALYNLSYIDIEVITKNAVNVLQRVERVIEGGYIHQDKVIMEYRDIWCTLAYLNDYKIENIDKSLINIWNQLSTAILKGNIRCNEAIEEACSHLLNNYDQNEFNIFVTTKLREYFASNTGESSSLQFNVISMSLYDTAEATSNEFTFYTFTTSLAISCIFVVIGICAFCYNEGSCVQLPRCYCKTVDDGNYFAMIIFALHFYDFSSDINLCIEMWFHHDLFNDSLLLICAIGGIIFIITPYALNLYYAANIKHMISNNNESAKSYFDFYSKTYTSMVVFTGSAYASLVLVSSNIFGFSIFSCGLTRFEYKKMAKIRLLSNVILENIPQLILQCLYAFAIKNITLALVFAFIASFLSVISISLSYYIDRDVSDAKVIQYYLVAQCDRIDNEITKEERRHINVNKGRRRGLATDIAQLFGISSKYIEIGASLVTKYGVIVSVVHYIFDSDLLSMKQLYSSLENALNQLFRTHFHLNDDFFVKYHQTLSITNRTLSVSQTQEKQQDDNNIIGTMQEITTTK